MQMIVTVTGFKKVTLGLNRLFLHALDVSCNTITIYKLNVIVPDLSNAWCMHYKKQKQNKKQQCSNYVLSLLTHITDTASEQSLSSNHERKKKGEKKKELQAKMQICRLAVSSSPSLLPERRLREVNAGKRGPALFWNAERRVRLPPPPPGRRYTRGSFAPTS